MNLLRGGQTAQRLHRLFVGGFGFRLPQPTGAAQLCLSQGVQGGQGDRLDRGILAYRWLNFSEVHAFADTVSPFVIARGNEDC